MWTAAGADGEKFAKSRRAEERRKVYHPSDREKAIVRGKRAAAAMAGESLSLNNPHNTPY